jgi:hypothetical protein
VNEDVYNRFKNYSGSHCWQYEVRKSRFREDLERMHMSSSMVAAFRPREFDIENVSKSDKERCDEVKRFIETYEWLGKMPARPTHRFLATFGDHVGGALVMATPNTFSNLLGKENRDMEKLISRGACAAWTPKGLGSRLIMGSIKWMTKNTDFRIFTAYSDPEAKELGTIYQACNFIYLGQTSGTSKQYFDPCHPERGWFSDRNFRHKSKYYMYADNIGVGRQQFKKWMKKYSPDWTLVPEQVRIDIKKEEKRYRQSCLSRETKPKHKYAYILGSTKAETKKLRRQFKELNPHLANLPYPKQRGT